MIEGFCLVQVRCSERSAPRRMRLPRVPNHTRKDPLESKVRKGIQATYQRADWQKLGSLDEVSFNETASVHARVDRILRHQRVLQTRSNTRPMDTPPTADVLSEDVEATQETVQRTAQAGVFPQASQNGSQQPKRLLVQERSGSHLHEREERSRRRVVTVSRTLATNMGMGNAWLAEQGLISLKEQWSRIHYPD